MYWQAGKFIFDLVSVEAEFGKSSKESYQEWMKRIHLKLVSVFGSRKEIDIIRNIKSIELLTDFLLRKIMKLAEHDNSTKFAEQVKEVHQTYKEAFDHTNHWLLKVNDLINHPGK